MTTPCALTANGPICTLDARSRLSTATSATGAQNQFGYGAGAASHLPTSAADSGGNTLSYGYDANGNLASTSARGAGQTGAAER